MCRRAAPGGALGRHPASARRVREKGGMTVELTPEQLAIFAAIEGGDDHLFITGRAGTGKSTLLRHLTEHSKKQIIVCAPTGVAALNVGGQTIHSLLKLPLGVIADAP